MFSFSQYHVAPDELVWGAAEACALVLLALVWRGRAADWYVCLAAILSLDLALAADSLGARVWDTHYFLAAHLFFVIALAAVVCRVRAAALRWPLIALALGGSAALCAAHRQLRDRLAERPGALGAVAVLDAGRKPGEPVIVCSPMIATTIQAHARAKDGIYVYRWPGPEYRHYFGTAVFDLGDYLRADDLAALGGEWAWVVDTDRWDNGTFTVPMPPPWTLRGEQRFKEIYGNEYEIVVRLYQREK